VEEMYIGTQISHKEFIKKIPKEKISLRRGRPTWETAKMLEFFAEDMQSLEEVWYIYPLFSQPNSLSKRLNGCILAHPECFLVTAART
jgi:hypothetical protein